MASNDTDPWSPQNGTTTFTALSDSQTPFSPSRYSYTSNSDSQHRSSDSDENGSSQPMRRITVSPSPSQRNTDTDSYTDDNSIDEVEATLNNLEDELDDTEQALTEWSHDTGPSYTSASRSYTRTGTYTGYTGSPSYVSLPSLLSRSPVPFSDPRARLSRITERTEDSRPHSGSFAGIPRTGALTPDHFRRSALLGVVGSPAHSRSSTDPGSELPPPGRAGELIAQFETNSPSRGHSRNASVPHVRSSSPYTPSQSTPNLLTSTSYYGTTTGYGSTYGYSSRPSSPTKSQAGTSASYTGTETGPTLSSFLSPPRPSTSASTFRSTTPGGTFGRGTASYLTPSSYTQTPPSAFSRTVTNTRSDIDTKTGSVTETYSATGSYTGTGTYSDPYTGTNTNTLSTVTQGSTLRRPQTSPRSPLASVRNIVALWKERTPSLTNSPGKTSVADSGVKVSPEDDGLFGIRRRAQRANGGREPASNLSTDLAVPNGRRDLEVASLLSSRSGQYPPGFDLAELTPYTQTNEAPLHIGLLWYLNVHAPPPYRWQRCQALLYPHMLLLSWLASGGGRGIVALDLLNCTNVQSAPSPTHPNARDDVGTAAARMQSLERDGQPLMDMLVPFHMIYADGIERLAAESLLERQKWVNRIWEAVNRPVSVSDSGSITRSPTGSIRTILSIESRSSTYSNGSRSTVFVPPLSSLPSISDFQSNGSSSPSGPGVSRRVSLVSTHHTGTVDDTAISGQEYVYRGDPRAIRPSRRTSLLRRSGSMTDLDEEFASALQRAKDAKPGLGFPALVLGGSPVTISSGPNLGRNIVVTPPPSVGRGSDKARSEASDDLFYSAGSKSGESRSSYHSDQRTGTGLYTDETFTGTVTHPSTSGYTRTGSSAYDSQYSGTYSGTYTGSYTGTSLSRAREVRRRGGRSTSRSFSSGYHTDGHSDKENSATTSGSYTPGSASYTIDSESYGSGGYTNSGGSHSGSGSYTPSRGYDGSHTRSGSSGESRSCVSEANFTPGDSSETGYDVCPSSDLTSLSRPTSSEEETLTPSSSAPPSDHASESGSEPFLTASQGESDYVTADSPSLKVTPTSPKGSITSFESFPTIPSESEYDTADSGISHYRTPSEPSPESNYVTAEICPSEPEDIPTEQSTPTLSSVRLSSESGDATRSIINLPSAPPSVIPSIRSSSVSSVLLPELPPSLPSSVSSVHLSPSPRLLPLPPSAPPSESSIQLSASPELSPLPPSVPSLSPLPSPPTTTLESPDIPTPSSVPSGTRSISTPTEESSSLPLPPVTESVSSGTSVLTPSTFALSPSAAPSEHPSTRLPEVTTVSSLTESSTLSYVGESERTPVVPTLPPPSPQPWADETNLSYESSQLEPSPSFRSIAIPEGPDASFETSFLRPSGSEISSVNRLSTIPETPTISMSLRQHSPFPPLTPVPVMSSSIPSSTDIETPSSLSSFSTVTAASLVRTTSTSSASSSLSQSSISSSVLDSRSLADEPLFSPVPVVAPPLPSPSTIPSLLTTPSQVSRTLSPRPLPVPTPTLGVPETYQSPPGRTPEPSMIVSITTPRGSPSARQTLGTLASESAVTERDLSQDIDRLAEEIRRYDQARGDENRELAGNVQALRNELQDLSEYLRRTPSPPASPIYAQPTQPAPRSVGGPRPPVPVSAQRVERSAGGSSVITSLMPGDDRGLSVTSGQLSRATSSASSIGSFLSSHHSDDELLASAGYPGSPPPWQVPLSILESDDSSFTESLSSSSGPFPSDGSSGRPLPPPSPSPSSSLSVSTARPLPPLPNLSRYLESIKEQLEALWEGQTSTNHMLDDLRDRLGPQIPGNRELTDRLLRIEDLLQSLISQSRQAEAEPSVLHDQPLQHPESVVSSSDSGLTQYREALDNAMPAPAPARPPGPSIAEQLSEILSASIGAGSIDVQPPPPIVRFTYDLHHRRRSDSPILPSAPPPRAGTAPPFALPRRIRRPLQRTDISRRREPPASQAPVVPIPPPSQPAATTAPTTAPTSTVPQVPVDEPRHDLRDLGTAGQPEARRPPTDIPPPAPIFQPPSRPQTAPVDLGSRGDGIGESWYHPRERPSDRPPERSTAGMGVPLPPHIQPQQEAAHTTYLPMPPPPVVVTLPPIFEAIVDAVRQNRAAQDATIEQQRELMRYMRSLNEWLERDVHDRQSELRGVVARVDQLRDEIRGLSAIPVDGQPPESESSSSGESEGPAEGPVFPPDIHRPGPRMPEPEVHTSFPPGFVPYPSGQPFPQPVIPSHPGTQVPVFPPVIPAMPVRTPTPPFTPVIPSPVIAHPPAVPMDHGFRMPGQPGPMPTPYIPTAYPVEEPPFIPPSLGRPSPHVPFQQPIIHMSQSPQSSSVSLSDEHRRTPRSSRRSSRRRSSARSRRSRSPSESRSSSSPGIPVPGPAMVLPQAPQPPIVMAPSEHVLPQPLAQPPTIIQVPPQVMQPIPQPQIIPGAPIPVGTGYPPGAPVVLGRTPSSSSRGSSRSGRSPVILERPASAHMIVPPVQPPQAPIAVVAPPRSRRSSRSSRSRSPRPSTPIVVQQPPQPQPVPMVPPSVPMYGPMQPPPVIIPTRTRSSASSHEHILPPVIPAPTFPQPPVVTVTERRSRSRSSSPHRHYTPAPGVQPILQPVPTTQIVPAPPRHERSSVSPRPHSRGRSYTPSPRRRHRRPYSRSPSYSPGRRRPHRSRSRSISPRRRYPIPYAVPSYPPYLPSRGRSYSSPGSPRSYHRHDRSAYRSPPYRYRSRTPPHYSRAPTRVRESDSRSPRRHPRSPTREGRGDSRSPPRPHPQYSSDPHRPRTSPERRRAERPQEPHDGYRTPSPRPSRPERSPSRLSEERIPITVTVPSQRSLSRTPSQAATILPVGEPHVIPSHDSGVAPVRRRSTSGRFGRTPQLPEHELEPEVESEIRRTPEGTPRVSRRRVSDERTAPPSMYEHEEPSPVEADEPLPVHPRRRPSRASRVSRAPSVEASPRHETATPLHIAADLVDLEQERERLVRTLSDANQIIQATQHAEEQRENEFRQHEEDRDRIFLESQDRRDQEAQARADGIWHDLESRLAALEPPPPPVAAPDVPQETASDGVSIHSVRTAVQQATSQHISQVLDTLAVERENDRAAAEAERRRVLEEAEAAHNLLVAEKDRRIQTLEEELATLRAELENERNEKQQRATMDAETREREYQALVERDEAVRNQLSEITDLLQLQREAIEQKKELMESRWSEKEDRREKKDSRWTELRDMVEQLQNEMLAEKEKAEEARTRADSRPGIEQVIQELTRHNSEQQELLRNLSESWRADCARQHEETINNVRSTAQEQVPFNVQGYLDEFSKALATEVRMLLGEVGKLREERRALQHELGYLLCMKSKYGPGGEFEPDWKPPPGAPGGPPAEAPPPEQPPAPPEIPQTKPGWRSVHPTRRKKKKEAAPPAPPTAPVPDLRHQIRSWATWQPNPNVVPSPSSVPPNLIVPDRESPGLFGPRTPSSSSRRM